MTDFKLTVISFVRPMVRARKAGSFWLTVALALLSCTLSVHAADTGDEVVVVFNSNLPESREVAEAYAKARQVPEAQVLGFSLPKEEAMSRTEFRDSLEGPLSHELQKRGLWQIGEIKGPRPADAPAGPRRGVVSSKIRYAVLCYGVPLRIEHDPNIPTDERLKPELRKNGAAVDSELAFLPIQEQHPPLAGPLRNPLFRATNTVWFHPTNGILLVARLDGPSPEIARGLVEKALEAERHGLWGRAYLDLRNSADPSYKPGDDWIKGAAEVCRRLGFETVVEETGNTFSPGFPMSQIGVYIGWYDEHISGPFGQAKVEFMPGAFAYHLHSFSASSLRTTTRHWVGPLLAKGATCAMGCVDEPFLPGTPDVGIFAARFLYNALTFGEAAYACQPVLSWQTTVVGDPLYRPAAKNPDQFLKEFEPQQNPLTDWCYFRLLDANLASGKPTQVAATFLEDLGWTKRSAILTEKLGDLYGLLGKPNTAVSTYAQALQLQPSPMQRLRILLNLAEKNLALGQDQAASDNYQQIIKTFPDYTDRGKVYEHLATLARKMNNTLEADAFEAEAKRLSQIRGQ